MLYQRIKRMDTKNRLGKRVVSYIIPEEYRKKFSARYKEISRVRMIRNVCRDRKGEVKDLFHTCLEHISPVTEPLALISQVTCSGGMFINQLFDGHPETHSYPHELLIDYPQENHWPKIDLKDDPRRWFEMLLEKDVLEYARNGYWRRAGEEQSFPFIFLPSLQRDIFFSYLESLQKINLRHVFDGYLTSYFGAWLNNQNATGSKKVVTAYGRELSMSEDNMRLFFEVYPDGRLISVIRDPHSWWLCAQRHEPEKHRDFEQALGRWEADAQAMLRNRQRYGDRVCIINFEDLVGNTKAVMHHLANFLEIKFIDTLLVPSFNTFTSKAHPTMQDQGHPDTPAQGDRQLTGRQQDIIDRMSSQTYPKVMKEAVRFG
jgi:hypothetical protein